MTALQNQKIKDYPSTKINLQIPPPMIRYSKDIDQIVTLTLDMKDRLVNVINHEISKAFIPVLQHLKEEKDKGKLKGVIITSAKKTFLTGGDLDYLYHAKSAEEVYQFSQTLKQFFRDIESPGVPVVAAINGTALGTGFEMAMACHYRIVIDDPLIRLGHPEVSLGLMPGSGSVIRMMWLLGITKTFDVLTSGKSYMPKEALEAGIIDALAIDKNELMEKAKVYILSTTSASRPWDMDDGAIPKGTAYNDRVAGEISMISAGLSNGYKDNFPAFSAILSTLVEGSKVDFDTACRIESRYFTNLLLSKESKNMIKAFWYDFNAIKGGANRPKGFGKFRPKRVGIVGAGRMGSGIAFNCVMNGMEVVLKDVSKGIADRGKDFSEQKLSELAIAGEISKEEKNKFLNNIITTESFEDFKTCDLVIECVFENEMVKSKVTKESEMYMDEYAFLASNTISIPITQLAASSVRPENYIGLHFFAPVEEVPLVEIVKGKKTSDETIARAFDFVKKMRKTPIIVKDSWGFFASRVQNTYILEGLTMLEEGYPPALIENLGIQAGMPKGALALADEMSLKLGLKYENQAAENYGPKYIQHPAVSVLDKMVNELSRPGKAAKSGFYDYTNPEQPKLWEGLAEHFPNRINNYAEKDIIDRFLFAQSIEAVWCLQENIIQSVPEANLGSIYGFGFPAFKGGVIQYINDYGIKNFVEKCEELEKVHGPRFKAPSLLKKKVEKEETL
ncbi:MAG: 3-hydroxyacyl-CoA dehydrogenase/enoyl-CoA hydratase/3-hydroxybutyryl-CoA epimerase [Saprospiraceae bacterium]|jgi:3-hydroxyacyl-CoA dehydrogenase/enoyl-CoA hydratase/3-hydroxybutyryl-CoA epimerase